MMLHFFIYKKKFKKIVKNVLKIVFADYLYYIEDINFYFNRKKVLAKMKYDERSKKLFIEFLKTKGFENIKDTDIISPFSRVDITAVYNNKHYAFELKDKTITSDTYGDVFCSKSKYTSAIKNVTEGTYDYVFVVNFYADETFALSNIKSGKEQLKFCPSTTKFGTPNYRTEMMWVMPQQIKYKIENNTFIKLK